MYRNYGSMILKKGCILYHTSDYKFMYKNKSEKPFLFCSFNPYDYNALHKYVHIIKLKRNVRLLFMVDMINNGILFSALPFFFNNYQTNLAKLKKENLDIVA